MHVSGYMGFTSKMISYGPYGFSRFGRGQSLGFLRVIWAIRGVIALLPASV